MATLKETIAQAIADFDGIKNAIEESGVAVPYDTNTSEYGNLVRQAVSLATETATIFGDEKSIIIENKEVKIVGFENAQPGSQPLVNENGVIEWVIPNDVKNIINVVQLDGVPLEILDKTVNIPIASDNNLGVVKSSTGKNKIAVDENGEMKVTTVSLGSVVQTENEELVLSAGSSNI